MIQITDEARTEIKRVLAEKAPGPGKVLRVYVAGHG